MLKQGALDGISEGTAIDNQRGLGRSLRLYKKEEQEAQHTGAAKCDEDEDAPR